MKKQEYIDLGLSAGLSASQIESVLCKVLGLSRTELFKLHEISSKHIYEIQKMFFDMQNGKSEEYVLEQANFYGRDFFVNPHTLIPRNDTELLVSVLIEYVNISANTKNTVYVDVWTGTGCIAATVLEELRPLHFYKAYGLDVIPEAVELAQKNTQNITNRDIEFIESNLLEGIFHREELEQKNLLMSANLPYIRNSDQENMDASVLNNEPESALYGGEKTWFELYEKLIKQIFQIKQIHQLQTVDLFIEIGYDQSQYSREYLSELWLSFEYFKDSSNIERVIHIFWF